MHYTVHENQCKKQYSNKKWFYVYKIINKNLKRLYYGSRRSFCPPDEDIYYEGSSKKYLDKEKIHWNTEDYYKKVIKTFATREEAYDYERKLIQRTWNIFSLDNKKPYFLVNCHIPGVGFTTHGLRASFETREKLRQAQLGKEHTPEHREKLRQAQLGKEHTPETREKLRQAQLGEKNHNYGKEFTPEHREKIRQAKLNRTPEQKDESLRKRRETLRLKKEAIQQALAERAAQSIQNLDTSDVDMIFQNNTAVHAVHKN